MFYRFLFLLQLFSYFLMLLLLFSCLSCIFTLNSLFIVENTILTHKYATNSSRIKKMLAK